MRLSKQLILSLLLLFFVAPLFGQIPGQGGFGNTRGQTGGSPQGEFIEIIDTFGVQYFYVDNPNDDTPFADTLVRDFQKYDVTRSRDFEYAHLGTPGSPARPLFFQPNYRKGLDIGYHQFDLYLIDKTNSPIYRIENPLTRAAYSQNNKDNLNFKGEYSRNFANGINVSVYGERSNHIGQFRNQQAKNTAFANNWWFHNKNGKYDGFFTIITNSNLQEDNFGIELDADSMGVNNPITLQVNVDDGADTRHTKRSFMYTHYYKLIGAVPTPTKPTKELKPEMKPPPGVFGNSNLTPKDSLILDTLINGVNQQNETIELPPIQPKDSLVPPNEGIDSLSTAPSLPDTLIQDSILNKIIPQDLGFRKKVSVDSLEKNNPITKIDPIIGGPPKRAITLGHQIAYHSDRYLFSDTSPDSLIYDPKFFSNLRGIRNFIHHRKLENDFRISTFKLRDQKGNIRNQRDLLEAGLTHTIHFVTQENEDRIVNNLFLHGRFNFNPKDRLKINTYFHYGLLSNLADYRAVGTLEYSLPTLGSLEVGLVQQAYSPSLIANRLILSETLIWENDFNKIFETSLKGVLKIPKFDLEITGQYHLINNYQFYGEDGSPQQTGTAINVGQIMIKKDFTFWKFHFNNTLILQQTSNSVLRLPQLLTKQSFYFAGYLLKRAIFTHVGFDFRLTDDFMGDAYFAPTGQFQLQNDREFRSYPLIDLFVNFKVKQFRFFFEYENFINTWSSRVVFQTLSHPERLNSVRLGVSWRFAN